MVGVLYYYQIFHLSLCLFDVFIIRNTYIFQMFISSYKYLCLFITNILCKHNIQRRYDYDLK